MSSTYSIVEPHPSVAPRQQYITTGRGGAGNAVRAPSGVTRGSDASGPASRASDASLLISPRKSYITGRGGAGNLVNDAPRMFSFDEELQHQMQQTKRIAPVYHVGRGGAGNLHRSSATNTDVPRINLARRDSKSSADSSSSAESGADAATRNLKKGLRKLAGVF